MTILAVALVAALAADARGRASGRVGVVRRGRRVGYRYFADPDHPTGAWAVIRKGSADAGLFGYVLHECLDVADWAPKAAWNPPR